MLTCRKALAILFTMLLAGTNVSFRLPSLSALSRKYVTLACDIGSPPHKDASIRQEKYAPKKQKHFAPEGVLANTKLQEIFVKGQNLSIGNSLKAFWANSFDLLVAQNAMAVLRLCSKHKVDISSVISLRQVAAVLRRRPVVSPKSREVAGAIYGLRAIPASSDGFFEVLDSLTTAAKQCGDFAGPDIGSCMYGLQHLSADRDEVRNLLAVLATRIGESSAELRGQDLCNALFGKYVLSCAFYCQWSCPLFTQRP